MVEDVFALHKITAEDRLSFPIPIKEYQRYVFGDGQLAQQYGTDLAKAFIDHWSGSKLNSNPMLHDNDLDQNLENDYVVAAVAGPIPTTTIFLREHFTAELSRYLASIQRPCAIEVDLHRTEDYCSIPSSEKPQSEEKCQMNSALARAGRLLIVSNLRASAMEESIMKASLTSHGIATPPTFIYLIMVADTNAETTILPTLSRIVNPSIRDIEAITQSSQFNINESFSQYILGRDYATFCRFVRLQNDGIVQSLLDFSRQLHDVEQFEQNLSFLEWEVGVRGEL